MLSERDLLQYLKYHLAPWKGMLNSWKKIPDHARPKTYLPDGSGPEKLFKGIEGGPSQQRRSYTVLAGQLEGYEDRRAFGNPCPSLAPTSWGASMRRTVASVVAFVPFVWSYPVQSQVLPSVQPGVQFDAALRAILTELDTQYGTALKMVF